MRAFVALEVGSPEVLDGIVSIQSTLKATGADIKLVERENLHFTLKFLGEISDQQAKEVASRLGKLQAKGGEAEVQGVGAFPSPTRPRVIWVGVTGPDEPLLLSVAKEVVDSLEGIGETDERGFKPHLTVARVRSERNLRGLEEAIKQAEGMHFGRTSFASVKLKASQLTPQGPIYSDLGEFALA